MTSFKVDPAKPDVFELRAVSIMEYMDWQGCDVFTVKGSFDSERWRKYDRPMSTRTHQTAMDYLQNANESGETIRFGTIGAGLKKLDTCVFESKGLFIESFRGTPVVLSVHVPI